MDSKYYLDFIDEGSYKRAYSISINHTYKNIDKKEVLQLLSNNGISQKYFEDNIDQFVYVEPIDLTQEFYYELDTQKQFEDISIKVYYDEKLGYAIMDKCYLQLVDKSNPLSLLNSNNETIELFINKLEEKMDYFIERDYVYLDLKFDNMCTSNSKFDNNTELYIIDFDTQFCYNVDNTLNNVNSLLNKEEFFKLVMIFIFCSRCIDSLPKTNILYKYLQQYLINSIVNSSYDLFTFFKDVYLITCNDDDYFTPKEYLFFIFFNDMILLGDQQFYDSLDEFTSITELIKDIDRNIFKKIDIYSVDEFVSKSVSKSVIVSKPQSKSQSKSKSKSKPKSRFKLFSKKRVSKKTKRKNNTKKGKRTNKQYRKKSKSKKYKKNI